MNTTKVKLFQPTRRTKIKPSEAFKEEVFAQKVGEGLQPRDAAVVAGYTGQAPTMFAGQVLKRPAVKKALGDIMEKKARLALKSLTQDKADQATFAQLAQAASVLSEKARLERGQSTSNAIVAHIDTSKMNNEELRRYLEEKSRGYSTN